MNSANFAAPTFESKAVRVAKAQFTAPTTTPPWKDPRAATSSSSQLTSILAKPTIIDPQSQDSQGNILNDDVKTSFTAYKALDKLRVLAEAANAKGTSDGQRAIYQKAFQKGLADLQKYLASAPSDKVNLAFDKTSTSATSMQIKADHSFEVAGKPLTSKSTDPLPGLTGTEKFSVTLSTTKSTGVTSQTFTVDLSTGPQPPTITSVAASINAQISSAVVTNADGSTKLDSKGNPVTKWGARFEAKATDGKWNLVLDSPGGLEKVRIDQIGSKDALVVASGQTSLDAPTATQVFRLNDPGGAGSKVTLASIQALDRAATAQNVAAGRTIATGVTVTKDNSGKTVFNQTKTSNVFTNTDAAAITTDAQGYSYVVGNTKGDLGSNVSDGDNNLFLTKMDGAGNVVWQRSLGAAGTSSGASVQVASDGSIVVAGTVSGAYNGMSTDGDMVVAKYAANGDEKFSTVLRSGGADVGKAVTVGADGSVFVAGRVSNKDGGDAVIARLDATGKIAEKRVIDTGGADVINGLAMDKDGNLLALMSANGVASVQKMSASSLSTSLGSISLGTADARAIAVGPDGTVVVGGATRAALSGSQVNSTSGDRDGFVTRIDSALSGASTTYIGSAKDDQVDSIAFLGNDLYVGGRTTGDLAATKKGSVDGFVSRIDTTTGAIAHTNQFGAALQRTEPVRIAADVGGDNAIAALGFGRGTINPDVSSKVGTQTALRPGDYFSIKADDGGVRKVLIQKDDTFKTIADRIQSMIGGSKGTVTAVSVNGKQSLRIQMKAGHELEILAGADGVDALSKLGMEPQRIAAQATLSASAPKVRPGGNFSLGLNEALSISSLDNAKAALAKITDALSMTQTAYRSLYWDDTKVALVDGVKNTGGNSNTNTSIEKAQLANYQAALTRLSGGIPTSLGF
ncbi:hypothetical protein [Sphingomonas sp. TDK1]|uniref:hypothetical protein n=1 Tax=Sphingomonas sp. TDK1 TaxID=453247 RepID=UPI001E57DC9B|nr:hypothetical protein [Sphingomonas sp. TDK1]